MVVRHAHACAGFALASFAAALLAEEAAHEGTDGRSAYVADAARAPIARRRIVGIR
jgi:hypothetical protein